MEPEPADDEGSLCAEWRAYLLGEAFSLILERFVGTSGSDVRPERRLKGDLTVL